MRNASASPALTKERSMEAARIAHAFQEEGADVAACRFMYGSIDARKGTKPPPAAEPRRAAQLHCNSHELVEEFGGSR